MCTLISKPDQPLLYYFVPCFKKYFLVYYHFCDFYNHLIVSVYLLFARCNQWYAYILPAVLLVICLMKKMFLVSLQ